MDHEIMFFYLETMMDMKFKYLTALIGITFISSGAWSQDLKITGFAQITAGRVFDGTPTQNQTSSNPYALWSSTTKNNYSCPCFTANYEYSGVYQSGTTSFAPESLAGIQGDYQITPKLSATVQAVARGADNSVNIDWAYGTYKLTPNLSVQFGRKRLPLYYYSDYMYIGYAYPWVRPNADLYNWQIYSFDGVSVVYRSNWDEWALKSGAWVGSRSDSDNSLLGNLYYGTRIDERWKNMLGGYVSASNDIVEVRGVIFRTDIDRFQYPAGVQSLVMTGANGIFVNGVAQNFYGLSVNVDKEGWLLRTELNVIDRPSVKNTYYAQSYSFGRQFGAHTVTAGWSQFREKAAFWPTGTERHDTTTLSYRWDYTTSQALKVQLDSINDQSGWLFTGNARLLSASWNIVY